MKKLILAIAALLISTPAFAQLPTNTTIPEGTCQSVSSNSGVTTICANSTDHQLSVSVNGGAFQNLPVYYYVTTNVTNATTVFANMTGISMAISASRTYHIHCDIFWSGTNNTTGPKYQWTGPIGASANVQSLLSPITGTTFITQSGNTYNTSLANTGTVTPGTTFHDVLDMTLVNGTTAGTVVLQQAANGVGTITYFAGSSCFLQ